MGNYKKLKEAWLTTKTIHNNPEYRELLDSLPEDLVEEIIAAADASRQFMRFVYAGLTTDVIRQNDDYQRQLGGLSRRLVDEILEAAEKAKSGKGDKGAYYS